MRARIHTTENGRRKVLDPVHNTKEWVKGKALIRGLVTKYAHKANENISSAEAVRRASIKFAAESAIKRNWVWQSSNQRKLTPINDITIARQLKKTGKK